MSRRKRSPKKQRSTRGGPDGDRSWGLSWRGLILIGLIVVAAVIALMAFGVTEYMD